MNTKLVGREERVKVKPVLLYSCRIVRAVSWERERGNGEEEARLLEGSRRDETSGGVLLVGRRHCTPNQLQWWVLEPQPVAEIHEEGVVLSKKNRRVSRSRSSSLES